MDLNRICKATLDSMDEAVYVCDGDDNLLHMNRAAEALAGCTFEKASGRKCRQVLGARHGLCHPECPGEKVLSGEVRGTHEEVRTIVDDGRSREAKVTCFPLYADGVVVAVAVIIKSTTQGGQSEPESTGGAGRSRNVADDVNSIIMRRDTSGRILFFNRFAQEFFGYSEEEILGRNVVGTIIPETDSAGQNLVRMCREISRQPERFKTNVNENMRRNGERVWVAWTNKGIRDDQGRLREILCVGNDVSQLRRAQEALRDSEARYRAIFDTSSAAMMIVQDDLTISLVNDAFVALTGCSREELEGRMMCSEFLFEGLCRRLLAQDASADGARPEGAPKAYEVEVTHRNGEARRGVVTAGRIPGTNQYVMSILDITERTRAEGALRESERRYRLLAENATDIIWTMDLDMRLTYVSASVTYITGWSVAEALSLLPDELLTEESAARAKAVLAEEVAIEEKGTASENRVRTVELEHQCKDDSTIWVEAKMIFLRDSVGRPVGLLGVSRDITARKRAEEERQSLEEQLRQSQKMEAIGQLAGGIAHDFNNLLTGILGYASMLRLDAESGELARQAAGSIQRAAERAAELTRQLLGFARRGKHQNIPVDLNETILEVLNILSRTINKDITIVQNLTQSPAMVLGDPAQMQQVVLNLAVNARDAMPNGGKLTLATTVEEVGRIGMWSVPEIVPGRYVLLRVSDTGSGIPAEIRGRIFEPFFTTKEQGKGTGMGLATVYGIVKNHHGNIKVHSREGRGTTFEVYLPLFLDQGMEVAEQSGEEVIQGTGRILLVDDEEIVRNMASAMLRTLGYDVLTAKDGREAVALYQGRSKDIDLVILDMVMPIMNGRDCFHALREMDPEVRAVLSTGYGLDGAAQNLLDEGMLAFVQKPYQMTELSHVVAEAVGKKK